MVHYFYDAWGNCEINVLDKLCESIAMLNPFRYRSYYYDTETNLYYLNTRYYDPETGRFISQDDVSYLDPEHVNGLNLFAYCGNNPVMRTDENGTNWWKKFWSWVGTIVAIVVTAVVGVALTIVSFGTASPIAGLACSVIGGALIGMSSEMTNNLVTQVQTVGVDNVDFSQTWKAGVKGLVTGAISGMISYGFAGVAGEIGAKLGFCFGKATIGGMQVSKVFSVSVLTNVFKVLGSAFGNVLGVILGDRMSTDIFGQSYTGKSLAGSITNTIQGWFLQIGTWLSKI